jgi:gamma-glutamyltranspeptidase
MVTLCQSHTSIVDASGMVVSITSTVNLVFGSRIMDTVTGVLFNNEVRGIVYTIPYNARK